MEIVPVTEWEDLYGVTKDGRIWSYRTKKFLKPHISDRGYNKVKFSINSKQVEQRVHRVVALMFVDNPNSFTEVNHLDGDKTNNCADNLEWSNRSLNMKHAYKAGLLNSKIDSLWKFRKKELAKLKS